MDTNPLPTQQDNPVNFTKTQQSTLLLWCVLNAAISPFYKLTTAFGGAFEALKQPIDKWVALGLHKTQIERFSEYKSNGAPFIYTQTLKAYATKAFDMVFLDDEYYPKQLKDSLSDAPPLLFIKGNKQILSQAQIAIVGTRKPSTSACDICEQFTAKLASEGFWITSGLAEGIDKHAHIGALKLTKNNNSTVRTIAVLGNGINQCYPKQNQAIYDAIINRGGAVVSELLPDAKPLAHNFPRRNRLVSGLSLATLVVEAAHKSGSLITANLAAEQGKLVFAIPGHIYNQQSKGCHELIREGAILVDSPKQVIEDLNLPKRLHANIQVDASIDDQKGHAVTSPALDNVLTSGQTKGEPAQKQSDSITQAINPTESTANSPPTSESEPDLPKHLQTLLSQLDWVGQDLDKLLVTTKLDVPTLLSQLMELELLGQVVQQGGLYIRCRT